MTEISKVICYSLAFMCAGPILILANQYILRFLNFPYPLFLGSIGVGSSAIFSHSLAAVGYLKIENAVAIGSRSWFRRVLPVGVSYAVCLAFSNIVYLYLNVGFIQMLKCFAPVVVLFGSILTGQERPQTSVILAVSLITLGTIATVEFSPESSAVGLACAFTAEMAEATRLLYSQYFLQDMKYGVMEGLYILMPACAVCLFSASMLIELPTMVEKHAFSIILSNPFVFSFAAFAGIAVNYLGYALLQVTSGLTLKILGSVRSIGLVYIGVLFYDEQVTRKEMIGYGIAMIGLIFYNLAKSGYFDGIIKPIDEKSNEKEKKKEEVLGNEIGGTVYSPFKAHSDLSSLYSPFKAGGELLNTPKNMHRTPYMPVSV